MIVCSTNEVNALGGVTAKQYTTNGKLKAQSNPDGSTNAWTYYLDGRPKRQIQRNGAYWETTYDDAKRWTLRSFYSAGNTLLATNRIQKDRRGNVIRTVDAAGFASTNLWDGLDRCIVAVGPVVKVVLPPGVPPPPSPDGSPMQTYQQAVTNYYDAAGIVTTNLNAFMEQTIIYRDALQRQTRLEIRDAANNLVHEE